MRIDGTQDVAPRAKGFCFPIRARDLRDAGEWKLQPGLKVPDIRIVAAEMYVTNVRGNSQVGVASLAGLVDGGIRTLSGGQFSMQVDGPLAVQSNAVPQLSVEALTPFEMFLRV